MVLICIERVALDRVNDAYAIVQEYYEAVDVVVRDDAASFARDYFGEGSGIWLAGEGESVLGCIALRPLPQIERSGEVKRLYVKPESRGQGIAEQLLEALEEYARALVINRFISIPKTTCCRRFSSMSVTATNAASDITRTRRQRSL